MILRRTRPIPRLLVWLLLALALLAGTVSASPDPHPVPAPVPFSVHRPSLAPRAPQRKRPNYEAHTPDELVCRPFGECEPCPEDDLKEPFCMPFGNRRLLHCRPAGSARDAHEVPAWEACGKVVKREQRLFYEFVTANILLLVVCLVIYAVRTSELAKQQYRQLAAKIGIPSGAWQV